MSETQARDHCCHAAFGHCAVCSLADCIASGQHLSDCDEDGYCNLCGYQDAALES